MPNLPATTTDLALLRDRYKAAIAAGRLPAKLIPATKEIFGMYPQHAERWVALLEQAKFDPEEAGQAATRYEPVQLVDMRHAIKEPAPTPARLVKYMGEAAAKLILSHYLIEAAKLLNVGKHIEQAQVLYLTDFIMKQYAYLKLSEIKHILDGGVTGRYGQIYDRLDVGVIGHWFYTYDQERTHAMELIQAEAAHNKAQDSKLFHPDVVASLKAAAERTEARVKQSEADRKAEKEREREERKRVLAEQQQILFNHSK